MARLWPSTDIICCYVFGRKVLRWTDDLSIDCVLVLFEGSFAFTAFMRVPFAVSAWRVICCCKVTVFPLPAAQSCFGEPLSPAGHRPKMCLTISLLYKFSCSTKKYICSLKGEKEQNKTSHLRVPVPPSPNKRESGKIWRGRGGKWRLIEVLCVVYSWVCTLLGLWWTHAGVLITILVQQHVPVWVCVWREVFSVNSPKDNERHQGPQLCIRLIKQQPCSGKDWTVSRKLQICLCVCVNVWVSVYLCLLGLLGN